MNYRAGSTSLIKSLCIKSGENKYVFRNSPVNGVFYK